MLTDSDGKVLAFWWDDQPNFGDLLTPWLISKITGRDVAFSDRSTPHYVAIGSIIGYVKPGAIVWGTGSFGTEGKAKIEANAEYLAVRGPLTRNKLRIHRIACPPVYGDPALLVPEFYWPRVEKEYELGIVLRHSEEGLLEKYKESGVKVIWLKNDDVEQTIRDMLACKRILTSSLHGLILADAFKIPNAWMVTGTPHGLEFKYFDYFLSVGKVRKSYDTAIMKESWSLGKILKDVHFDGRDIELDLKPLRKVCPFGKI